MFSNLTIGLSFLTILGITVGVYEVRLENAEDRLKEDIIIIDAKTTELALKDASISSCNLLVNASNEKIATIETAYQSKVNELESWKKKPPAVRYEVIYAKYPSVEQKSNECDATFTLLDEIKKAGL